MTTTRHLLPDTGSRILVVGLGMTGLSCARFLVKQGYEVAVTDSRETPPALVELQNELPDVAVFLGGFDEAAFRHAECLVVSPGISIKHPLIVEARARAVPVLGDIEIFAMFVAAPVVAITGSNGKSTVTTLLGEMAKTNGRQVRVGGNIGTPALDLLDEQADLYVLELSSFQLETTSNLMTQAAVVLNISEDHMDRYDSLQEYIHAKARIFQNSEIIVVNSDDANVMALLKNVPGSRKVVCFGLQQPTDNHFGVTEKAGEAYLVQGNEILMPVSEIRISGWHNVSNALAALALGQSVGLAMNDMLSTLRVFPGLAHRTQWIAECRGVEWFNDSKATNVGATIAALQGVMANKVVLIAGGQGKGQDFSELRDAVASRARCLILFGEDADKLEDSLQGLVPVYRVMDMAEAVQQASLVAQQGDAVLLSPACASFDMFNGFAQRGEVFAELVREICQ